MQFNIGLDLNRSHTEMKHNALPRARNIMLNDFGNAFITEYGHSNILPSPLLLNGGSSLTWYDINNNSHTATSFAIVNACICGYINVDSLIILFIYDTNYNTSYILKFDPITTSNYKIILQKDNSGVYRSF